MGNSHDRRGQSLNQKDFELLLGWLDSDSEYAGRKYEDIRRRLIRIFASRGCMDAEDLADHTINRVASKIKDIRSTYSGDPAQYFHAVANNVHHEYLRQSSTSAISSKAYATPADIELENIEIRHHCLDRCMQSLSADNRELILQYYQEEKMAKVDRRKVLAAKLGLGLNALRIRAHRIKIALSHCVQECMEKENSSIS